MNKLRPVMDDKFSHISHVTYSAHSEDTTFQIYRGEKTKR